MAEHHEAIDKNTILFRRQICEQYIHTFADTVRGLYWDAVPEDWIDRSFLVKLNSADFEWKGDSTCEILTHTEWGKQGITFESYRESCVVNFEFIFKDVLVVPVRYSQKIKFDVRADAPYDDGFSVHIFTGKLDILNDFHQHVTDVQRRFKLEPLNAMQTGGQSNFGYYCDVVRKKRVVARLDEEIANHSFYSQLTDAHGELMVCFSHILTYYPLLNDMAGRKVWHDDRPMYLPNLGLWEHSYLIWCASAFDRIYNFWETMVVLLYNYEQLDIDKGLSFHRYMQEVLKRIKTESPIVFMFDSLHLSWLIDFYNRHHTKIQEIRHRIVHHQFTEDHKGILTSKFSLNASDNIMDKKGMEKINAELHDLMKTVKIHFELCAKGFEQVLLLIDQIPIKED